MTKNKKKYILQTLQTLKPEFMSRFKIKEIGLFGSLVHDEATPSSDIDVLVDFEQGADLFDLVELGDFLEEKLQQKVDVVSKQKIRPELQDFIFKEVVLI